MRNERDLLESIWNAKELWKVSTAAYEAAAYAGKASSAG